MQGQMAMIYILLRGLFEGSEGNGFLKWGKTFFSDKYFLVKSNIAEPTFRDLYLSDTNVKCSFGTSN